MSDSNSEAKKQVKASVKNGTRQMPMSRLGVANTFPKYDFQFPAAPIYPDDTLIPEEKDGFFYDGHVAPLPYTGQEKYGREQALGEMQTVVLENQFMRATVYPQYGGRLASIYDKVAGRELLFDNPVFQPANLAIRNAWFSGGIEWNAPLYGHTLLTCSDVYVARVEENGEEILRIYEFDRSLETAWQVDLILDSKKPRLWMHVKTINVSDAPVDFYWWTNIAVRTAEKTRILANTTNAAVSHLPDQRVTRLEFPLIKGAGGPDGSYTASYPTADSIFFAMKKNETPWVAAVDKNGSGMFHASTKELCGRKFFVWGENTGAHKWMDLLSQPDQGNYVELQGGLRPTQLQTIPMAPDKVFEWTECIEALDMDAVAAHDVDYAKAIDATNQHVDLAGLSAELAAKDAAFRALADKPIVENVWQGSAWGHIFEVHAGKTISPSMRFDAQPTQGEQIWLDFSNSVGFGADDVLGDWNVSPRWMEDVEENIKAGNSSWKHHLHFATYLLENNTFDEAFKHLEMSNACKENPYAWRALGLLHIRNKDIAAACAAYECALKVGDAAIELVVEYSRLLFDNGLVDKARDYVSSLNDEAKRHERILILQTQIALRDKDYALASSLLENEFATIREGENILTDMWFSIGYAAEEQRLGRALDDTEKKSFRMANKPPQHIDLRMQFI